MSRVKGTPISVSTASKTQNSQYLFMEQLEELTVPTSGGTAEQSKQLKQLWSTSGAVRASPSSRHCATPSIQEVQEPEHVVDNFIFPMHASNSETSTQRVRSHGTITASLWQEQARNSTLSCSTSRRALHDCRRE